MLKVSIHVANLSLTGDIVTIPLGNAPLASSILGSALAFFETLQISTCFPIIPLFPEIITFDIYITMVRLASPTHVSFC